MISGYLIFMGAVIGTAGIPSVCNGGNIDGLKWVHEHGLGAYEVEFVRGVRMPDSMANEMELIANKFNIKVSCHAPYFINCNNLDKYGITKHHLLDCVKVNEHLKFSHIVFHVGYLMGLPRSVALKNSIKTIKLIINEAYANGFKDFTFGPEVAGKKSQVGTINEVISICKEFKECKPVIDWAHLHAVTNGGLKSRSAFLKIIELISDELGKGYLNGLHCHFSEIEFSSKGERRHQPLGSGFGPDFNLLAGLINDLKLNFSIICESPLNEFDAVKMQGIINK